MATITYSFEEITAAFLNQNTAGTQTNPSVATLADGRYVSAYHSFFSGLSDPVVYSTYQPTPLQEEPNRPITLDDTSGDKRNVDVGGLTGGRYVLVYENANASNLGVSAVVINANATLASGLIDVDGANVGNTILPKVAGISSGGFAVAWETTGANSDVSARVFDVNGGLVGSTITVNNSSLNTTAPAIASLDTGGFAIAYASGDGADQTVEVARFTNAGAANGTFSLTRPGVQADEVDIVGLPGGRFAVVFRDDGHGTGTSDISFVIFNADLGNTGVVRVNATTAGNQSDPHIAYLGGGAIVVSWQQSTGVVGLAAFDLTGAKVGESSISYNNATIFDAAITQGANGEFFQVFGTPVANINDSDFVGAVSRAIRNHAGTAAAETLYGDGFKETFNTGDGADGVIAFGGVDTITLGNGDDYAYGGEGNDIISGDAGTDILLGENGNDVLNGGAAQDYLYGLAQNDVLNGDGGVDVLIGDVGEDTLNGGDDNDYLYSGSGNDTANGGAGADLFVMEAGDDVVNGDAGDDFVYAGDGNDTINGNDGTDILLGEAGDDVITGGLGVDYVFLGDGSDTYVVDRLIPGLGVTVLYNFTAGAGDNDVLRLVNSPFNSITQVRDATVDTGNGYSILVIDADTQIWLIGVTPGQLVAGDVLFA